MKISPQKSENFFVRAAFFSWLIVLFWSASNVIIPVEVFSSQDIPIPKGEIEVSPETVAPAWQIIWEKARHMGRSGDVDGAIALYQNLLRQRPGLSEARFELAVLFVRAEKRQPAIVELEKVLEVCPKHLRAIFVLASLLEDTGQYKRAADLYTRAMALLVPALPAGEGDNATAQAGAGSADLFQVEVGLYHCLKGLHRDSEALVHLQKALRLRPEDKSLEFILAKDLMEQGRAREALPHLRHLVPVFKTRPSFIRIYVEALNACARISSARKVLEGLILPLIRPAGSSPKGWSPADINWAVEELYRIYLLDDDTESAVQLIEGIKEVHSQWMSPQLLSALGRIYFGQRRYIASINTFTSVIVRCPEDRQAHLFLARAFQNLQLINKAADSYMTVYTLSRDPLYAVKALRLLASSGEFYQAKSLVEKYLSGNGGQDRISALLLARIYIGTGDLEGVLGLIRQHPAIIEKDHVARELSGLFTTRLFQGDSPHVFEQELFSVLKVLSEHARMNRPWIMAVLDALSASGENEAVNKILVRLWSQDHSVWVAARLARYYTRAGNPQKALDLLAGAGFYDSRLEILRSDLLVKAGQTELALKSLKGLSGVGGWIHEMRMLRLAQVHVFLENYEQARYCYNQVLSIYPDHLRGHEIRFRLYASSGLWVQANWEALGIFILRGTFDGLQSGGRMPGPGLEMKGESASFLSPDEILSGPVCKKGGQACQLLLAISYERHGDVREAVSAWNAFLNRNPDYWPGYGRLARLMSSFGNRQAAVDLEKNACRLLENSAGPGVFTWLPAPPWSGSKPEFFWNALHGQALKVWQNIYCK